jgi:hypothetical protein
MSNENNNPTTIRVEEGSDVVVSGSGAIRVLVIRNDGAGSAAYREVAPQTPVDVLVTGAPGQTIRANGQVVNGDYQLQNGDKISVTPNNIAGA